MYTEDDEKVKIKKNKSNNDLDDFYTSFNETQEKKPSPKNKKNVKVKEEPKDESEYDDFYGNNDNEVKEEKPKGNSDKIVRILIIIMGFLIFLTLIGILIAKKLNNPDIKLEEENIVLNIGSKASINYKIVHSTENVTPKYESSDPTIVKVSETGQLMAMSEGKAVITISYVIGGKAKSKTCNVEVNNSKNVDVKINLSLSLESGSIDKWQNEDAIVLVKASSVFGISSVKYAINCTDNCTYTNVSNNKIKVSDNGENKVKVIAKDQKNQEKTQEITVKIDKEAPSVSLNQSQNIVSTKSVEVCAICKDSLSGCKEEKVCKTYSSSASNQALTVYDNAGNKATSARFNVTINSSINPSLKEPCSLTVTSDGTVKATLRENATYYGFNSNYTGANELSKKITINASKKGESKATVVYYYVKNANGTGGKCYITVIKTCSCTDPKSTAANCPVTCVFKSQ